MARKPGHETKCFLTKWPSLTPCHGIFATRPLICFSPSYSPVAPMDPQGQSPCPSSQGSVTALIRARRDASGTSKRPGPSSRPLAKSPDRSPKGSPTDKGRARSSSPKGGDGNRRARAVYSSEDVRGSQQPSGKKQIDSPTGRVEDASCSGLAKGPSSKNQHRTLVVPSTTGTERLKSPSEGRRKTVTERCKASSPSHGDQSRSAWSCGPKGWPGRTKTEVVGEIDVVMKERRRRPASPMGAGFGRHNTEVFTGGQKSSWAVSPDRTIMRAQSEVVTEGRRRLGTGRAIEPGLLQQSSTVKLNGPSPIQDINAPQHVGPADTPKSSVSDNTSTSPPSCHQPFCSASDHEADLEDSNSSEDDEISDPGSSDEHQVCSPPRHGNTTSLSVSGSFRNQKALTWPVTCCTLWEPPELSIVSISDAQIVAP